MLHQDLRPVSVVGGVPEAPQQALGAIFIPTNSEAALNNFHNFQNPRQLLPNSKQNLFYGYRLFRCSVCLVVLHNEIRATMKLPSVSRSSPPPVDGGRKRRAKTTTVPLSRPQTSSPQTSLRQCFRVWDVMRETGVPSLHHVHWRKVWRCHSARGLVLGSYYWHLLLLHRMSFEQLDRLHSRLIIPHKPSSLTSKPTGGIFRTDWIWIVGYSQTRRGDSVKETKVKLTIIRSRYDSSNAGILHSTLHSSYILPFPDPLLHFILYLWRAAREFQGLLASRMDNKVIQHVRVQPCSRAGIFDRCWCGGWRQDRTPRSNFLDWQISALFAAITTF